ncbi:ATP synthase F(0) complex subunit B1, mitochondrial-like [Oscarella lobularis]|uniref:ATP synthase F(0) complex subunit B1, mitochondrial-like n=1 Tax=Oscarella lobularis TaxID=121494 RepID=UPI003313B079
MLRTAFSRGLFRAGPLRAVSATGSRWFSNRKDAQASVTPSGDNKTLRQLIEEKTGKSGPWVLGAGLAAYAVSKEILIIHSETLVVASVLGVGYYLMKRVGGPLSEYLDQSSQEILETMNSGRVAQMRDLEECIEAEKNVEDIYSIRKDIFDILKQNNVIALETEYRRRQAQVASEVTKRLNYQVDLENLERRLEQDYIVDYVEKAVKASITPQQEADTLNQCISDLRSLAVAH